MLKCDMSWNSTLRSSSRLVSFLLGVTYNTVASPENRKRWGYAGDEQCVLCDTAKCGVDNILSGCKLHSLEGGR